MENNTVPEYITIGTIVSPWGLQGHVKVAVETDFPQRFSSSSLVYVNNRPVIIDEAIWRKGNVVVKLNGVDTVEEVERLIGNAIEIHHSQLFSLEDGKYFHFQLIGLDVATTNGDVVGKISEILSMSSADVYVIDSEGGEILIPATEEIVQSIDLDKRIMIIEPMDGLLDLNRKKTG